MVTLSKPAYDEILGYLEPGKRIVVDGLDGLGKTTFATLVAKKLGLEYVYFMKLDTIEKTLASWKHVPKKAVVDRSVIATICYSFDLDTSEKYHERVLSLLANDNVVLFLPSNVKDHELIAKDEIFAGDVKKVRWVHDCMTSFGVSITNAVNVYTNFKGHSTRSLEQVLSSFKNQRYP
ncbi:MAG: hypothetical protein QXL70_03620 [Metallosphaera sp.]